MIYMTRLFVVLLGVTMLAATFAQQGTGGDITLTPFFTPDPQTLEYIAGGSVSAADRYGIDDEGDLCSGFVASVPDHSMRLSGGSGGNFGYLRVYVESDIDTTLVITRVGSGFREVMCDDDTFGLDPQVEADNWPTGIYSIYVGTFDPDAEESYTISFSEIPAD